MQQVGQGRSEEKTRLACSVADCTATRSEHCPQCRKAGKPSASSSCDGTGTSSKALCLNACSWNPSAAQRDLREMAMKHTAPSPKCATGKGSWAHNLLNLRTFWTRKACTTAKYKVFPIHKPLVHFLICEHVKMPLTLHRNNFLNRVK